MMLSSLAPGGSIAWLALYSPSPKRLPGPNSAGPVRERQGSMIRVVMMIQETEKSSATASPTEGILLITSVL